MGPFLRKGPVLSSIDELRAIPTLDWFPNIDQVDKDKALWSAMTETRENQPSKAIASFLETISKSLPESGLF